MCDVEHCPVDGGIKVQHRVKGEECEMLLCPGCIGNVSHIVARAT